MSARHKLNSAHFLGFLVLAGLVGWLTQSVYVFAIAFVAFVVAGYHARDIRL